MNSLSECLDGEAETVMQLRSELREKEMKLTDIRLEALSSAHQLDQLREAMNRMQVCKQQADQLQHRFSERNKAWQTVCFIMSNPRYCICSKKRLQGKRFDS